MFSEPFLSYLQKLQQDMCAAVQDLEHQTKIVRDPWTRSQGGGGVSCVLQHGDVFDSAGVNVSHVTGQALPPSASLARPELAGARFEALGLSSVIHPKNPHVPTAHMNVRFFCAYPKQQEPIWWFGGGFDLTPYYPNQQDCVFWHRKAHAVCQRYGEKVYPKYKQWADDYFYLPHRKEHRGIGGLFFDDLNPKTWGWDAQTCLAFTKDVGEQFFATYIPIVHKRMANPFSEAQKQFQRYRRGRYVEFNLVYDRGTLFGLQSGGRTESILMSLPPEVSWQYCYQAEPNSPEQQLLDTLQPKDWLNVAQNAPVEA